MDPQILLCGVNGNMGKLITSMAAERGIKIIPFLPTDYRDQSLPTRTDKRTTVAVNFSNYDWKLAKLQHYCQSHGNTFIQCSSRFVQTGIVPGGFVGIHAPILAPSIVYEIDSLRQRWSDLRALGVSDIEIRESHQHTKGDTSAVARMLAKILDFPESRIQKIRDREYQEKVLKIPPEHLDGHAFHEVTATIQGIKHALFGSRVYGREPYVIALFNLVMSLVEDSKLEPGLYSVLDLKGKLW
jgi:hypothetical protein